MILLVRDRRRKLQEIPLLANMNGHGIVFLLLAAVASFSPLGVDGADVLAPKKCCLAKQYSAYMTVVTTVTGKAMTTMLMQADFNAEKIVMENFTVALPSYNSNSTGKILIDFKQHLVYVVPPGHPERCRKLPYTEKLHQCIPDEAQYLTTTYMGPESGEGQLTFDVWRVKSSMVHKDAPAKGPVVTIAVSRTGCVPIMEGVHVARQNPRVKDQIYMFTGYQTKLVNPSAFDLPASCK